MRNIRTLLLPFILGLLLLIPGFCWADNDDVAVSCTSPTVSAPSEGGTVSAYVNCLIDAPGAISGSYRITSSSSNMMLPTTVYLNKGLSFLQATLQPTVISPDNTVSSISGTSSGFSGTLSSGSTPKMLRFEYKITTRESTPGGMYYSLLTPPYYKYRICTTPSCNKESYNGNASAYLSLNISTAPVSVSCGSEPVQAVPGGGPFSLDITCTLSGGNPDKMSPGTQNMFSPGTVTLTNGTSNLTATLQPGVTSPDSSVTGISGTAGGGFSGNINSMPAKIQIRYQGTTTNSTTAGTYTSAPVSFTWSTL